MKKLTKKQKLVLGKIYQFISSHGYPPTVREIAGKMGFSSPKAATDHLNSLEKKGYLSRNSSARSIRLTGKALSLPEFRKEESSLKVPLIGRIAAGYPMLADENIEDYLNVPKDIIGNRRIDFALKVKGNSMIGDHIMDGDIILVRSQNTGENGEMVIALIEDEATVKRIYKAKDEVVLRSSNPSFPPIKVTGDIKIQGKVMAVQRVIK
ncbi:MAG: transcriptional repressor LexA [Candidatus Humimicrobiaceae bacterium]